MQVETAIINSRRALVWFPTGKLGLDLVIRDLETRWDGVALSAYYM
jgi:hypothetical protein